MLYTETVTPQCMACLKRLMEIPELGHFYLVGGTALSLRYGHRSSEDIDLFTDKDFDNSELEKIVRFYFIDQQTRDFTHTSFGIFVFLGEIKVDFMKWNEEWIGLPEYIEGIRLASDKDIYAMKLQAAMTRRAKKDFFDIALLIDKYSLPTGIEWYKKKYPYNDDIIPLKSLTDFEKADADNSPVLLNSKPWEACKQIIIDAVKNIFDK